MNYYDARIIEGCCVFSYEVKTPDRSRKNKTKRKKSSTWGKALLRFFLFMLLPFAFIIDSVVMAAKKIYRKCRSFLNCYVRGYVFVTGIISSVSVTVLIPLLFSLF